MPHGGPRLVQIISVVVFSMDMYVVHIVASRSRTGQTPVCTLHAATRANLHSSCMRRFTPPLSRRRILDLGSRVCWLVGEKMLHTLGHIIRCRKIINQKRNIIISTLHSLCNPFLLCSFISPQLGLKQPWSFAKISVWFSATLQELCMIAESGGGLLMRRMDKH